MIDKRKMLHTIFEEEEEEEQQDQVRENDSNPSPKPVVLSMTKLEMHQKIIQLYALIEVKRIMGEPPHQEEKLIHELKTILRKRCM